ncbi:MAG TPA: glutaredoxin family protein [Candidatus Microsaccharimonas sp.]|nr:glutaredoxin family protein [Candidatus Microsaccharimonas sp.]
MSDSKSPIIVYGAEWCAFCHVAMDYFDKLNVKYEYRNVDDNRDWLNESVSKSGQTGIPVLDIEGDIVVGFDRPRIDASLKAHALVS